MNIRYGNDLELTEVTRLLTNEMASLNAHLRDGNLDSVFLRSIVMMKKLEQLQDRLNELKYPPKVSLPLEENAVAAERE